MIDFKAFKQRLGAIINPPDRLNPDIQPHPEVHRVTHAPLWILLALGLVFALGIGFTAYTKAQHTQSSAKALFKTELSQSETPDWFAKKQNTGIIAAKPKTLEVATGERKKDALDPNALELGPTAPFSSTREAELQGQQQIEQDKETLVQQHRSIVQNALGADTTVFQPRESTSNVKTSKEENSNPTGNHSDAAESENYLLHTRTPALSPFEIKAGTVIPSVLMGGINSTLPGQLIAQVTQNVYDTASGEILLIPQGSRLIGRYDHQIANGQKRVFVVWNRLIYPDASSVTLNGMTGVDTSGYAGFADQTDMHFWPTFRNALLLSTISAAVQLSQPRATNGNAYSSNQVAAGALGQQMNQVGMNTIGHTTNQAPTLTIRPGYLFDVLVNQDMILPPWEKHEDPA
jgi:type IV secretory pathway VirB10-like protein